MAVPRIKYVESDSVLHRLSPLSKLVVLVLISVSVFVFGQWYFAVALALLLVFLHMPGENGFKRLYAVLKPLPIFIVLIVLAHIVFADSAGGLPGRAARGFLQSLRMVDLLIAVGLFLSVTDPMDLADAFIDIMRPFRRLNVIVSELSLMVMIVFGFIPLLFGEAGRLRTAQSVRSGPARRGVGFIRGVVPVIAPLVIGVFRRAGEMEVALKARYFSFDEPRSSVRRLRFGLLDVTICILGLLLFIAGIYAKLQADN